MCYTGCYERFSMSQKNTKKSAARKKKKKRPEPRSFFSQFMTTLVVFVILAAGYSIIQDGQETKIETSISQLALDIQNGAVESIVISGNDLEVTMIDESIRTAKKEADASLTTTLANYGVAPEDLTRVEVIVENPSGFMFWLLNLAPFLLPLIFIAILIWMLTRQVRGTGMQAFSFGQSKARFIDPKDEKQKVTFKDVAGVEEAKQELEEIVDFLKNPKKFLAIGASIPKGVMLMGSPGTGKTLLARAVAGEAGVPFFSISGSEFVEMFVGVGASRVRDLFKMAKTTAPAIVFVDEIDAVGRVRGTGIGGGNDEREQTLNQILVEMDGFEPNEKVIVMAATNRWDVLDPALLRPGRFDRRVRVDLPDRKDREAILDIHARKKPLAEDVNLAIIAERTPGFSGADLQSLMNEAAILAAREDRKKLAQFDLIRSIEKVMLGPERKSHVFSEREKKITAYHEAGHALVGSVMEYADPVHKISIISRGHAGGYTLSLPLEERNLKDRREFYDILAMSLGGYAVERMVFGDITTGPSGDLQQATAMARDMVTRYGMSDKVGPVALESRDGKPLTGSSSDSHSEEMAAVIDEEVGKILKEAEARATKVVSQHRELLDVIVAELMDKETIEREEFETLLRAHGVTVKEKKAA